MYPSCWTNGQPMFNSAARTVRGLIPRELEPVFSGSSQGQVLMVNSSGIYFTLADRVYLMCPARYGTVPIGISVEDFDGTVRKMSLAQGQRVAIADHVLTLPGGKWKLRLSVSTEGKEPICIPDLQRCEHAAKELAACGKPAGLSGLCRPLLLGEPLDPAAGLLCRQALSAMTALLRGLLDERQEEIVSGVSSLLGLGVGLTPSGDDMLLGIIYALNRSARRDSAAGKLLSDTVAAQAPSRTNRVSNAYLQAVAAGAPFERLENAWMGLDARFPPAEAKLLEIGSNSGSEMLLGLLLAAAVIRKSQPAFPEKDRPC